MQCIFENDNDNKLVSDLVTDLLDHIKQFLPNVCISKVERAIDFANTAHFKQRRSSGEPYIIHPLEVAKILASLHLDTQTIICALLHDIVEDTEYTIEDIEREFGIQEAKIVTGLTKIQKIENQTLSMTQSENLKKLLMAVAEDARVLLIKLADRLHNMKTLSAISDHRKRIKIAKETIDIYAPLAERIGIHFFKSVLYDISFEILYPNVRQSIICAVDNLKYSGQSNIDNIMNQVINLIHNNSIRAEVRGREKSPFSIWQKMEKKNICFNQLSDVFAIRIITDNILDCYKILGIIHIQYKVLSKEFFDYISTPKQNGYSSIHTVVLIENTRVEVQIRTREMHQMSELGMAAHWIYKNDDSHTEYEYQQEWLKKIRYVLENIAETNDILSNLKLEMYYDQTFCFTPKGDIIPLPKNATPLDFAFEIGIDIGSHYSKVLINGKLQHINTILQNGDQVEILTSERITIHHSWLNIVCTAKAKSEIKVYLERKLFEKIILLGNMKIYDECDKQCLNASSEKLQKVAEYFNTDIEGLMFKVGNNAIKITQVLDKLTEGSLYQKFNYYLKKYFLYKDDIMTLKTLVTIKDNANIKLPYCCDINHSVNGICIYEKQSHSLIVHSINCANIKYPPKDNEVYKVILTDNMHNLTNITLEIALTTSKIISDILNIFTDLGLVDYSIDISREENEIMNIQIDLKYIMTYQLESAINKLRNFTEIIDVTIC